MLGLEPSGQLLPQRLAGEMLERSSERNGAGSDARKSQSQVFFSLDYGPVSPVWDSKYHWVQRAAASCRPRESIGETGIVTLRHETWPPRFRAKTISLKLHHQLKSILSPERRRAPLHPETGRRSLMVYVPLPRPSRFLAMC